MNARNLICFRCKHWDDFSLGCKAFPKGIPEEIIVSNEHDKPLEGQINDIIFDPVEKNER